MIVSGKLEPWVSPIRLTAVTAAHPRASAHYLLLYCRFTPSYPGDRAEPRPLAYCWGQGSRPPAHRHNNSTEPSP